MVLLRCELLHLREWRLAGEEYTGRDTVKLVTYVLRDSLRFGLRDGYCILGLAPFNAGQVAT